MYVCLCRMTSVQCHLLWKYLAYGDVYSLNKLNSGDDSNATTDNYSVEFDESDEVCQTRTVCMVVQYLIEILLLSGGLLLSAAAIRSPIQQL
jgi:hypothetical protein